MNFEQMLKDLNQLLLDLKENFFLFFPKLIFALLIIFAGYIIARVVQMLVNKFFKRANSVIKNPKIATYITSQNFEQASTLLSKTFFWIIFIFFITVASETIGLPVITAWLSSIIEYLPNIFAAIVILIIGIIGGKILADLLTSAMVKAGLFYSGVLSRTVQYSIILISLLIAINQIGIEIALFTTILSILLAGFLFAAALSFALGAKTAVSNIIASYYVGSMYKEGNIIRINEIEGKILKITSTGVILKLDNGEVSIPAKEFNEHKTFLIRKD